MPHLWLTPTAEPIKDLGSLSATTPYMLLTPWHTAFKTNKLITNSYKWSISWNRRELKFKNGVLDQQCLFFPYSWPLTGLTRREAGTELSASAEQCRDGIPARRFQNSSLGHMSEQVCNSGTRQIPSYLLTHTDLCSSSALCPTKTLGAFIKACKSNYSKNKTKVINTVWMSNLPLFLFRAGISACRKFFTPPLKCVPGAI